MVIAHTERAELKEVIIRMRYNVWSWLRPGIALILLALLLTPTVYANGGAPNLAYVAGGDGGVAVIDVAQRQVTQNIQVTDKLPHMVQLSLDGRFLYVTQPELNKVALVSARTGETVCTTDVPGRPEVLALDLNTSTLFAAGQEDTTVTAIDVKDDRCSIARTFEVGGPVYGLGVATLGSSSSGTGNQLWVATDQMIILFDDQSGQEITRIDIPEGPRYISTPPGTAAYVTTQQGTVVAIDFNTHKTLELISGGEYGPMDYDAITRKVYVPDFKSNQVVILNPVDQNMIKPENLPRPLDPGGRPASIAITSDGQLGFVAVSGGTVAMFDIPGRQLITTIQVGGDPQFIITGVYPPALGDTPEQANQLQTIATIGAYVIVAALLIVPIFLFRRFSRKNRIEQSDSEMDEDEEDAILEDEEDEEVEKQKSSRKKEE